MATVYSSYAAVPHLYVNVTTKACITGAQLFVTHPSGYWQPASAVYGINTHGVKQVPRNYRLVHQLRQVIQTLTINYVLLNLTVSIVASVTLDE